MATSEHPTLQEIGVKTKAILRELQKGTSGFHIVIRVAGDKIRQNLKHINEVISKLYSKLIISEEEKGCLNKTKDDGKYALSNKLVEILDSKEEEDIEQFFNIMGEVDGNAQLHQFLNKIADEVQQIKNENKTTLSSEAKTKDGGMHDEETATYPTPEQLEEIISSLPTDCPIDRTSAKYPNGPELSILILGKVGNGKSKLGNNLLNERAFETSGSDTSVTQDVQFRSLQVRGRKLNIVDTPGTMDPNKTEESLKAMAKAIALRTSGYDAFVIVIRYPARMTACEKEAIDKLSVIFGDELANYTIIVFTGGDTYRKEMFEDRRQVNFQDYVTTSKAKTQPFSLGPILTKYNEGWVLVDNFEQTKWKMNRQMNELIAIVDEISKKTSQKYTNEIFQEVRKVEEQGRMEGLPEEKIYTNKIEKAYDMIKSLACFPFDATVTLLSGNKIPIFKVAEGDIVLAVNSNGNIIGSEVFMCSHIDKVNVMMAVTLKTKSCKLTASNNHYIPVVLYNEQVTSKLMKDIVVGDQVLICECDSNRIIPERVLKVERKLAKGMFNPITMDGTIIVNGIVATCYEEHIKPRNAHVLLSILRTLYNIRPEILLALNAIRYDGMPIWAYGSLKAIEYVKKK